MLGSKQKTGLSDNGVNLFQDNSEKQMRRKWEASAQFLRSFWEVKLRSAQQNFPHTH
jgi:hypothetical protein